MRTIFQSSVSCVLPFSYKIVIFGWALIKGFYSVKHTSTSSVECVQYIHALCKIFRVHLNTDGTQQRSLAVYLWNTEYWLQTLIVLGVIFFPRVFMSASRSQDKLVNVLVRSVAHYQNPLLWHAIWEKRTWNYLHLTTRTTRRYRNNSILCLTSTCHELLNVEQQSLSSEE